MSDIPKIRPCRDYMLVRLDPLEDRTTESGIFIQADTTASIVRTGTVLLTGPGIRSAHGHRVPLGVERGEKVAFLRWHLEHQTSKQVSSILEGFGKNLGLIRAPDVLFAYPAGENIDISQ